MAEKRYSKSGWNFVPDIKIRYGQERSITGLWKNIIEITNKDERESLIDDLIAILEIDTEQSGFFGKSNKVDCGCGCAFYLDDKQLYYMFFDNLKALNEQNKNKKVTDGSIINQAIKATIFQYAGGNGVNRKLRVAKTAIEISDDEIKIPSISAQKGQNCFYCTEYASISHNLWLLTGATSYFCFTNSDNFGFDNPEYKNDTHNFTIVEYDGKFRLYDLAMNNFCLLENDCIDSLLSGKGLEVENVNNPGVYAANLSEKELL